MIEATQCLRGDSQLRDDLGWAARSAQQELLIERVYMELLLGQTE